MAKKDYILQIKPFELTDKQFEKYNNLYETFVPYFDDTKGDLDDLLSVKKVLVDLLLLSEKYIEIRTLEKERTDYFNSLRDKKMNKESDTENDTDIEDEIDIDSLDKNNIPFTGSESINVNSVLNPTA